MMSATVDINQLRGEYAANPEAFSYYNVGGGGGAGLDFSIPFEWTAAFGGTIWTGGGLPTGGVDNYPSGGGGSMSNGIVSTILQGVQTGAQIFSQAPPSGSKFLLEAYPLMLRQAQQSGLPVDCYWFGAIVRVLPSGQYGNMATPPTLTDAELWWANQSLSARFYVLRCGGQGTPLLSGCHFDLMGSGQPPATGSGAPQTSLAGIGSFNMTSLVFIGIALVGAYLIFNFGKR